MMKNNWLIKLGQLSTYIERAKGLGVDLIKSNNNLYLMDSHTMAAINRSICLVEGFVEMANKNNFIAAIPFIRMQIDTCLRYYLSFIVDNRDDYIRYFNKNGDIKKYKPNNFKTQFTDTFLAQLLDKSFPGFSNLHKDSSNYIHFTSVHFNAIIEKIDNDTVNFKLGMYDIFNDAAKYLFVNSMMETTNVFIILVETWIEQKSLIADGLQSKHPSNGDKGNELK